jgi:hypothetical protein
MPLYSTLVDLDSAFEGRFVAESGDVEEEAAVAFDVAAATAVESTEGEIVEFDEGSLWILEPGHCASQVTVAQQGKVVSTID